MRILEVHAPYFRAHWRREHDVLAWGIHDHCDLVTRTPVARLADVLAALPAGWVPDAIVYGDDSRPFRVLGLEDAPCPCVMLAVDTHHHEHWQAHLGAAFDTAFVAQRDYLRSFERTGARATWLPLWAPDDLPPPAARPLHDVSFVGSLSPLFHAERGPFLDQVRARLPVHVAQGDYAPVFSSSRIVVNQTVRGDLNGRVFEAMACGAMLLTERTGNGLLDLFGEGEHLATYPRGDADAVVDVARRYLGDERARARVADAGRARVRAEHLESHRAPVVLAATRVARPWPPGARHTALARAYCQLAEWSRARGERLAELGMGPGQNPERLQAYLAEAERLARGPWLEEPHRSAVLGAVAAQRGELSVARERLAWAAGNGGTAEDHLALIDVQLRLGVPAAAVRAAERLLALHPDYDLAADVLAALRELEARAGAQAGGEA